MKTLFRFLTLGLLALRSCEVCPAAAPEGFVTVTGMTQTIWGSVPTGARITFSNANAPLLNGGSMVFPTPTFSVVRSNGWFSNQLVWGTNKIWLGDTPRILTAVIPTNTPPVINLWDYLTNSLLSFATAPGFVQGVAQGSNVITTTNALTGVVTVHGTGGGGVGDVTTAQLTNASNAVLSISMPRTNGTAVNPTVDSTGGGKHWNFKDTQDAETVVRVDDLNSLDADISSVYDLMVVASNANHTLMLSASNSLDGKITSASNVVMTFANGASNSISSTKTTLRTGLIAEYLFSEGQWVTVANSGRQSGSAANLFISPYLIKNTYWGTPSSITDSYALDPFGGQLAARFAPSGGTAMGQTIRIPETGTYTLSVYVASNTGTTQYVRLSLNTSATYSTNILVPSNGWKRVTASGSLTAGNIDVAPIVTDSANTACDVLIAGPLMERGAAASAWQPLAGDLAFGGTPAWVSNGVDFSAASSYATAGMPNQYCNGLSLYAAFRWATNNAAADAAHVAVLTDNIGGPFYMYLANGTTNPGMQVSSQSATAKLASNPKDGNWHLMSSTWDRTRLRVFMDDCEIATSSNATLNPILTGAISVASLTKNWYLPATFSYASVYGTGHTQTQWLNQVSAIRSQLALRGISIASPNVVAFDGDSITADQSGSPYTYPYIVTNGTAQAVNYAVSGSTVSDLTNRAARVDLNARSTRSKNVLFVFIGHNDLASGASAATLFADTKAYCLNRRTNGWNRIILATMLPSTGTGFNTKRNSLNSLIAADPSFYDVLCDFGGDATMGPDAAASNTALYSDGTHPTAVGQTNLAVLAQAAINTALQ